MASDSLEVLGKEMTKVMQLNDLAVEHWIRRDLISTEEILAKALNCLHDLSRHCTTRCGKAAYKTRNRSSFLLKAVVVGSSFVDVYNRAFLLVTEKANVAWDFESLDALAAVIYYNTALYYHLQGKRQGGDISKQEKYCFIVRYYHQADQLFGRYMECTRRPLWLFQAALWNNIGNCYQQRVLWDNLAIHVYVEQIKAIIEWIETPGERAFFQSVIIMLQLHPQQWAAIAA